MHLTDILGHWDAIAADLAEKFHLDLYAPHVRARPWPGIRNLIFGLLNEPSRLSRALHQEGGT